MRRYLKIVLSYVGAILGAVAIFAADAYFEAWFKVRLKFLPLPVPEIPVGRSNLLGPPLSAPEGLQ